MSREGTTSRRCILQLGTLGAVELALQGPVLRAVASASFDDHRYDGLDITTGKRVRVHQASGFIDFSGSYTSPQLGDLRLSTHGSLVTGTYRNVWRGRVIYGHLRGEADGTQVSFRWGERYTRYGEDIAHGCGHLLWQRPGHDPAARLVGARSARILFAPAGQGRAFPYTLPSVPWFATKVDTPRTLGSG